jgi:hypothetical protein
MKRLVFLSLLTIVIFLKGCDKENDENTGRVTFYTNAQAVMNCGSFDVEIYIDNSLEGIIKKPNLPLDNTPECNSKNSETLLVIYKPEGNYEFTARLTCSETLKYMGEFKVKKDSCSLVYIDLTYSEKRTKKTTGNK